MIKDLITQDSNAGKIVGLPSGGAKPLSGRVQMGKCGHLAPVWALNTMHDLGMSNDKITSYFNVWGASTRKGGAI